MGDFGVAVVIEDDEDVRNLLNAVLQQAGFDVRTAATGRDGVAVARQQRLDVITLDVGLPDIDGFEVLRRIRQFGDASVVMLTGRDEELDMVSALQGGAHLRGGRAWFRGSHGDVREKTARGPWLRS